VEQWHVTAEGRPRPHRESTGREGRRHAGKDEAGHVYRRSNTSKVADADTRILDMFGTDRDQSLHLQLKFSFKFQF